MAATASGALKGSGARAGGLIERVDELQAIEELIAAALSGEALLATIEGPAGIGKTELVRAAAAQATAKGLSVLMGAGSELEREFPFGVVRQLLEPPLGAADDDEREVLLSGAARLAGTVLTEVDTGSTAATTNLPAVLHGLYWLVSNLSERRPVLITVDDAHWADAPSLRFLAYLLHRLGELPVTVLAAARLDEPDASPLLAAVLGHAASRRLRPGPLTDRGVASLVRRELAADADDVLCTACYEATRGNPLLLRELLRGMRDADPPRMADDLSDIEGGVPDNVARIVARRLARLPEEAGRLAVSTAVVGAQAPLRLTAVLAGLEREAAGQAADLLTAVGIFEPRSEPTMPVRFVHPLVRSALHASLPTGERSEAHRRVAGLLAQEGAAVELIAGHLLVTEPDGDASAVDRLRRAGRVALARGAPESAVAYLRRALSEPPLPSDRLAVLLELGKAEALIEEPRAADRLSHVLAESVDASERAAAALELGRILLFAGRLADAAGALVAGLADPGALPGELAARLQGELLILAQTTLTARASVIDHLASSERTLGQAASVAEGAPVLATLAFEAAVTGGPASTVAEMAERALEGAALTGEGAADSAAVYLATGALRLAGHLEAAHAYLDKAIADARRRGSARGFATASCWRALALLWRGDVVGAEADARASLGVATEHGGWFLGISASLAFLLDALLERGDLIQAEAALERHDAAVDPSSMLAQPLFENRGRLRIAQGRVEEGLADLEAIGRWEEAWGVRNPGYTCWRSSAVAGYVASGRTETAASLAAHELAAARAFAAPRQIGIALRALARAEAAQRRSDRARELLEEAVGILDGSGAVLELARALVELGAIRRRGGERSAAREDLRRGLELAHGCGAAALASQARTELLATGARPRRVYRSGIDALTASELRICTMAVTGRSNREIAQDLFVSVKTVETHLGRAYQKLGVGSRREAATVLSAASAKDRAS